MSVLKRKRKLSSREFSKVTLDLQDMIAHDAEKISLRTLRIVGKRVNDVMSEYNELMYTFNETYVTKGHEENAIRRKIYIILMNDKLIELYKALLPFVLSVPKIKQKRILKYADLINDIIYLNEINFKRGDGVDKKLFDRIDEYNDYVKSRCKDIMEDDAFKFQRCHYYIRSKFEKAEFVKAARNLERYTLSKVKRLKEAKRLLYGDNLHRLSADIFYYCHRANIIYPICYEEYLERIRYLRKAKVLLEEYDKALSRLLMTNYYDGQVTNLWCDKYYICAKLVDGIIAYDNAHFRKLPRKSEILNFEELSEQRFEAMNEEDHQ